MIPLLQCAQKSQVHRDRKWDSGRQGMGQGEREVVI